MKLFYLFLVFMLLGTVSVSAASNRVACTREYAPVCGQSPISCIGTICPTIVALPQTYSNSCLMRADGASLVSEGACSTSEHITTPKPHIPKKLINYRALLMGSWNMLSFNSIDTSGDNYILAINHESISTQFCNNISGNYFLQKHTLMAPVMISTMMYCEGRSMTFESAFQLDRVSYIVDKVQLQITTKKGDIFTYKRQ